MVSPLNRPMFRQAKNIASISFLYLRNGTPENHNKGYCAEGTAVGAQAKRQRSAVPVDCWTAGTRKKIRIIYFLHYPAPAKCCGLPSFPWLGRLHSLRPRLLGGLRFALPTLRSLACHSFSLPCLVGTRPGTYPRREARAGLRVSTAFFPNDFVRIGA